MSDDLIARLRALIDDPYGVRFDAGDWLIAVREAADEIARLSHALGDADREADAWFAKYCGATAALAAERERVIEECARVADERADACQQAVEHYQHQHPAEPSWAASERCAKTEAEYIAKRIRSLSRREEP